MRFTSFLTIFSMILVILAVTLVRETAAIGPVHVPGTSSNSGCTKCSSIDLTECCQPNICVKKFGKNECKHVKVPKH